jgi:hypothetical protein
MLEKKRKRTNMHTCRIWETVKKCKIMGAGKLLKGYIYMCIYDMRDITKTCRIWKTVVNE